ncbi:N-acetylglucosamine-6-phosphate deacetylase [Sansalvadorimonas verongulae]|uniref:N-acetylglucosamine-6-phosphate deacetylase n=1 Tax=Sansalvadorimonas verongulae TaxID=2172824 RepID=UPI0018AD1F1D|nr:N-acetylglucosamine-6-phosphate deacetylase [Sansalvadorimonas verongulae]
MNGDSSGKTLQPPELKETEQQTAGSLCIAASRVLYQQALIDNYVVQIKDGEILKVFPKAHHLWEQSCDQKEEYEGILAPGFIDIHIHGANGRDVMDILDKPDALETISTYLPKEGVTSWYPTTTSAPTEELASILASIASHAANQPAQEAAIVGIHMEGPFISADKKGCHPSASLRSISITEMETWKLSAGNLLRVVTFAPELEHSDDLIQWCKTNNVVASIGHSNASQKDILDAIDQGAKMGTHLFNAMSMPSSRDSRAVLTILNSDKLAFEIIVDGHHLSHINVELAWKLSKDHPERFVLITDAMSAKGVENIEGAYTLGKDIPVIIRDGKALRADEKEEVLAGSIATMPQAVRIMYKVARCTLARALLAGSYHPALSMGLTTKGLLEPKYDADMVLLRDEIELKDELRVMATWRAGQRIFTSPDLR